MIGKKGTFSLKNFIIVSTVNHHEKNLALEFKTSLTNMKQLEEWTSLKFGKLLFDTDSDNWYDSNELNYRIIGKKQIVFLIEDTDKELFGYYFNPEIPEKYHEYIPTDMNSFHFNLYSNGRLPKPMKFSIKETTKNGICLSIKTTDDLIFLGEITLKKESCKEQSSCVQDDKKFAYCWYVNALCGKSRKCNSKKIEQKNFTPERIIVIEMI